MAESDTPIAPSPFSLMPSLEDIQKWTQSLGEAQQALMESAAANLSDPEASGLFSKTFMEQRLPISIDFAALGEMQAKLATDSIALWQQFLRTGRQAEATASEAPQLPNKDPRLADPAWVSSPYFDMVRQSYNLMADYMTRLTDTVDGTDPRQKEKLRFITQGMVEALSPANFAMTNPQVVEKTLETGGENLARGLQFMLDDIANGQIRQTDTDAFELGVNIAATPGKVVKETPLYQLIQYEPTTKKVMETPLIIFPPWINRFYILDLSPAKSFVKWAVDQGITVFMVSWKSADESMKDVVWDDYILRGQVDAIDTVRDLLDVPSVHTIGYCVAGTTLAATLALLAARGQADKVASATYFVAQVDFSEAGDLQLFVDDEQLKLVEHLSKPGYLDGRYMAVTFNMLRGRDLIWNYVVNNYLLGKDYVPFDMLYWNGDTTNLPVAWHHQYLTDLYRDNKLVQAGEIIVDGTPIDLKLIKTPSYVQAGREDHISPAKSVWKLNDQLSGPIKFILAGSGHIAGVVNPPANNKYCYWTCEQPVDTLEQFVANAKEIKGSWWPDWLEWLVSMTPETVSAKGARKPGNGKLAAIEDAPGRYVKTR
jgi:polyhydroxyalkanoate synthase subunit PhaC